MKAGYKQVSGYFCGSITKQMHAAPLSNSHDRNTFSRDYTGIRN